MCPTTAERTLSPGQVEVWLTRTGAIDDTELERAYAALLDEEERQRWQRFRFRRHRHTFLVAHALVRTSLSRYSSVRPRDWRFEANEHGRPRIAHSGCDLRFNLSHTDGLVACAVTRAAEVGVDVESASRQVDLNVADRFFAPPETEALRSLPPTQQPHRFLQYWTLKESYIKARGLGLALPLGGFAFSLSDAHHPQIEFLGDIDDEPARWAFWLLRPLEGYWLALALERGHNPVAEPSVLETVPLR